MDTGELCRLFSTLLSYPSGGYVDEARRCLEVARSVMPEAAPAMAEFAGFVAETPPDRLEELYTAAFDLEPACCPYAGHHLFGDPCKRSMMLVRLQQAYEEMDFTTGREMPDHVALLIKILPRLDGEARQEMEELVLGPALEKMAEGLRRAGNPYESLVLAARQAIGQSVQAEVQGAAPGGEWGVSTYPPVSGVQGVAPPGGEWGVPTTPPSSTGTV